MTDDRSTSAAVQARLLAALERAGAKFEDRASLLLTDGRQYVLGPRIDEWRRMDTAALDIVEGTAPREICLFDEETRREWQLSLKS